MIGNGLYPKPPDLRLGKRRILATASFSGSSRNGVRFTGMPGVCQWR